MEGIPHPQLKKKKKNDNKAATDGSCKIFQWQIKRVEAQSIFLWAQLD